jgi:polysaccharide export outer membrane protein
MRAFKYLFVIVSLAVACWSQEPQQPESLLIGSGDVVNIKVFETSELDQQLRVTDSGDIHLLLGGTLKVAGLTPSSAAAAIESVLQRGKYLLNPHVDVAVTHYATANVSVMGQVRTPGTYPIGTPRPIMDVLAAAGGLTEGADRKITIERRGTKERTQFFVSNDPKEAINNQVMVYPGDLIVVPKAEIVYVLGDVGRPGGYAKTTNDSKLSALQALAMAGGAKPSASASKARLIRKKADGTYEEMKLPLTAMQKGHESDLALQADDIIYVPFSFIRNMAMGASSLVAAAASATIYQF